MKNTCKRYFCSIITVMKKILAIALILTTVSIIPVSASVEHKIIKVIDGDTVYVDFNDNGIAEQDEKVRINGIDTFETKLNDGLNWQMKLYNLTQDEALGLGYYGKEFAEKELLNKPVRAEYTAEEKFDKNNRHLMSLYYDCNRQGKCKSYEQEVLKAGLATIYTKSNLTDELKTYQNLDKIKANAKKSHKLDLVVLNKKNGKYHKTTCEYGWMASKAELVPQPKFWNKKYKPSCCCFACKDSEKDAISHELKEDFDIYQTPYKHSVEIVPNIDANKKQKIKTSVMLLFNSPIQYNMFPSDKTRTISGRVLIDELNKLKGEDIYLATYGIAEQPEIVNAFIKAQKRKNKIFGIADVDIYNRSVYKDTFYAMRDFGSWKTDYAVDRAIADRIIKDTAEGRNAEKGTYNGNIMHNKFVTLGKNRVWTGSTNLSSSGTGGLNCNLNVLIVSPEITYAYIQEAKQMYSGKFHYTKVPYHIKNVKLDDGSILSVYFCPNPDVIDELVSKIDSAEKYVYVSMFFLTHDRVIEALSNAKQRGVDVKVITCASAANEKYSKHTKIREKGIPLKVENWTGKMHMKTIVIDDKLVTVGSMNATKTASEKNDENIVFIESNKHAAQARGIFETLWNDIPDKWLAGTPKAESPDSGNSCNDGLDNDHDWKYDAQDPDCAGFDYSKAYRLRWSE